MADGLEFPFSRAPGGEYALPVPVGFDLCSIIHVFLADDSPIGGSVIVWVSQACHREGTAEPSASPL